MLAGSLLAVEQNPRRRHLRPPHPWRTQDPHEGTVHAAGAGQGEHLQSPTRGAT